MSDATSFASFCFTTCGQFSNSQISNLQYISNRIAADSSLSAAAATAAQTKLNRPDISTADFDNLKVAIDLVIGLMNATNGGTIQVSVNTGGKVVLGFYKMT